MKRILTSLVMVSLLSTVPVLGHAASIVVTKDTTAQSNVDTKQETKNQGIKDPVIKKQDTTEQESKTERIIRQDIKNQGSTEVKVVKAAKSNTDSTKTTAESHGYKPIIIKSLYGALEESGEMALQDAHSVWVPLAVYKQINLNPITAEKNAYYITLPLPRVGGDMLYSGDAKGNKSKIRLPITMVQGLPYVDVKTMSPSLGVTYEEQGDAIVLGPQVGAVAKPPKNEIKQSVTLVFDPLVGTPYASKVAAEGTSVIAPTLFDIGTDGLVVKSQLNLDYVKQYKQTGYRVWPLVTNTFNPDFTSKILQDESKWPALGRDFVLYALAYGFDGYNFDFENVHYKDKAQLTKFVAYLSDLLHSYNIKSSIDVTGYSDSENWSLVYDRKALGKSVDYVVLMAYDETWASSTTAGPVASYPWVRRNVEELIKEVPSEKIILGVPYYMRAWTSTISVDNTGKVTVTGTKGRTLPMGEAETLKAKYKSRVKWNNELKINRLTFGNDELGDMLLAYKETGREPRGGAIEVVKVGTVKTSDARSGKASDEVSAKASDEVSAKASDAVSVKYTDEVSAKSTDKLVGEANTTKDGEPVSRMANGLRGQKSTITEIWFEDEQSMAPKLALVKELQLGGFGAWRKGFETDSFRNFVYKAYKEPTAADKEKANQKKNDKKTDKKKSKK